MLTCVPTDAFEPRMVMTPLSVTLPRVILPPGVTVRPVPAPRRRISESALTLCKQAKAASQRVLSRVAGLIGPASLWVWGKLSHGSPVAGLVSAAYGPCRVRQRTMRSNNARPPIDGMLRIAFLFFSGIQ